MGFELAVIATLIFLNGLFSLAEMAVVSARKARLQQRAEEGDAGARAALQLASDPTRFLSAVQIGITLIGVLAGVFGGASVAEQIALALQQFPALKPYGEAIGVTAVVVVITYFTLVFGELVPKRLALNDAERAAATLSRPMRIVTRIAAPLVFFLGISTDLVMRLLRTRPPDDPPVTEEEIKILIEQGAQAGVFEAAEQEMVASVFRLGDRRVGALMTPRTEIVWLDLNDSPEVNLKKLSQSIFSRFPVIQNTLDNVLGVVQSKDLLAAVIEGRSLDLPKHLVQPLFIPANMPALKVLEKLKESPIPMALVIDEFGGLQGLVTVNDLFQSIVGEILVAGRSAEPEIVRREDGSWLLDGMLPVDEFKEIFRLAVLPEEARANYQTLGGFVMTCLGRIPRVSDHFEWSNWRFEVVDMDGFRVDKILVSPHQTLDPQKE